MFKIFRAVILLPLTAGVKRPQSEYHDGSVSSKVLICSVLAVGSVFMIFNINEDGLRVVFYCMYALDILGALTMFTIWILVYRHPHKWINQLTSKFKSKLKVKFLWIFGVGCIVVHVMNITGIISCSKPIIHVILHLLVIVDKFVEMVFISYFSNFRFKGSLISHYALVIILIGNVVGWFFSYVLEFPELFHDLAHNQTDATVVINASCFTNLDLENVFNDFRSYLAPAFAEYDLLVITYILTMMKYTEYRNEEQLDTVSSAEMEQMLSNVGNFTEETSPLLSRPQEVRHQKTFSYYATFAIGILLDLPLIIGAVFMSLNHSLLMSLNHNIEYIYYIWEVYKLIFLIVMLTLFFVGFHKLNYVFPSTETFATFSASNLILILSAFFDMVFHTFGILAGMLSKERSAQIVLANNALSLILSYYQTVFIVQAQYVKKISPKPKTRWTISEVCLMLTLLGFALWLVDSIRLIQIDMLWLQRQYFGFLWKNIMHIVGLIALFYRFHCAIDLHILYTYLS